MAKEIEHKYLVINNSYKALATESRHIVQGYLTTSPDATIRVRIVNDEKGYLTVKSRNKGASRGEWEYEIPFQDALELLKLCNGAKTIDKTRYIVPFENHIWEVDEFYSPNSGLIVAEIELADENEQYLLPPFVGKNVTGDTRYYNSNIASTSD